MEQHARERPTYSLRDFRSIFLRREMRRFNGEYDPRYRRWRFPSPEFAADARALLADVELHVLHIPGSEQYKDGVHNRGGYSIVAGDGDEDAQAAGTANMRWRRGTATFVFRHLDDLSDARKFLFDRLRVGDSARKRVMDALEDSQPDWFYDAPEQFARTASAIADGVAWKHQGDQVFFRVESARRAMPRSGVDERASAQEVLENAALATRVETVIDPRDGEIDGLLVGRSAHHLAIEVDDAGTIARLERWKIATPLRADGKGEKAFDRTAAIHVRLRDGAGDCIQLRDPYIRRFERNHGALLLRAQRSANGRDLGAVMLNEEIKPYEDMNATLLSCDAGLAVLTDEGAYAVIARETDLPDLTPGARIRLGPSFPIPRTALGHSVAARRASATARR